MLEFSQQAQKKQKFSHARSVNVQKHNVVAYFGSASERQSGEL